MQLYTCETTIGDIAIYAMGAIVTTLDDLDCTLVLDRDGDLVAVKLAVDVITGRAVEISPSASYPKFTDSNAEEIWRSARAHLASKRHDLMDRAGIPAPRVEHEYSDHWHRPVAANHNVISFRPF